MRGRVWALLAMCGCGIVAAWGQAHGGKDVTAAVAGTGLTIYNQDFAVVRTPVALDLRAGSTEVRETGVTSMLEPDSVVLRDSTGRRPIRVLEQNYDAALGVQARMLAKFEGQTIDFLVAQGAEARTVSGKVLRPGSMPPELKQDAYGNTFYQQPPIQEEPVIEMEGKVRFGLPGVPLFPAATAEGLTLRPTLRWLLASERAEHVAAELDYVTRGMRWAATYNLLAPAGDLAANSRLEMVGWVNITNESGLDFRDAQLQLMAGDVNKLRNGNGVGMAIGGVAGASAMVQVNGQQLPISQRNFDDYYLYELHRTATLLDRESKQIEFLHVLDIPAERVYVYDGQGSPPAGQQQQVFYQWNQQNFGNVPNRKVWTMQEFRNSDANHLGMPLPAGRMRFYRRDADGSLQFVGENTIDHTPKDELVRMYLGNAFDLTGERTQVDFKEDQGNRTITERFEISLRNAKGEAVTVRVVEHMYRTATWQISHSSETWTKKDFATTETVAEVPAHGQKLLTYTVTYTW